LTVATGGVTSTVTVDGIQYKVHTFVSSGTFTVTTGGEVEYLIVAGGGGAPVSGDGNAGIGAGGAGGVLTGTSTFSTTAYTVVVGAGGANTTGNNSSLSSIIANGGGLGGVFNTVGGNGGSGGGGGGRNNTPGGVGTVGQGRNGGAARGDNIGGASAGGGGGGAGAVGGAGTPAQGGVGGIGTQSSINGTATYYAGGGGGMANGTGGAGGLGGGGTGVSSTGSGTFAAGGAGVANTGGGAGGGNAGGAGGSGIVIIRYKLYSDIAVGGIVRDVQLNGLTYRTHTFTSSATLEVIQELTANYVIVGGGGGGAINNFPGSGGPGGAVNLYIERLTAPGTYTVTIGGGGNGFGGTGFGNGTSGVATSIAGSSYTLTSNGGECYGTFQTRTILNSGTTYTGNNAAGGSGSGQNGQALNGGAGSAVGSNIVNALVTSGSTTYGQDIGSVYYFGGGGGSGNAGLGGPGGGGNGSGAPGGEQQGTTNTGGGGGGGTTVSGTARSGGSGIIIAYYQIFQENEEAEMVAEGGDEVVNIVFSGENYRTHIFRSSGTFTVTAGGNAQVLIVGGGGGGGDNGGGGGGGGGARTNVVPLLTGEYLVTIGSGGSGTSSNTVGGTTGNSSAVRPLTLTKAHSFYFDGTNDGINAGSSVDYAPGTGAFCVEAWIFNHRLKNFSCIMTTRPNNSAYADAWHCGFDANGAGSLYSNNDQIIFPQGTIKQGQWQHYVCCRNSSNVASIFVDGIRVSTGTVTNNFTRQNLGIGDFPVTQAESISGFISNARFVKGSSVYDPTLSTLTVPTAPLTAVTGTAILTAQDLSFIDNSLIVTEEPVGQVEYITPGTYSWTAPAGVTSVSAVAVGGGGSGGAAYWSGGGGGGGGLGWKNNIPVVPGSDYTVVVGAGGVGVTANGGGLGTAGGESYFINNTVVQGGSGGAGVGVSTNDNVARAGGVGGTFVGDGGAVGGTGGTSSGDSAGGGGGSAGYSGAGGRGAGSEGAFGAGLGGGAAGGVTSSATAGSGGGVGLQGEGVSGATASAGGSGGAAASASVGGLYGGGGGGQSSDAKTVPGSNGGNGAVRIIWGTGRAFPSTGTADVGDVGAKILTPINNVVPSHFNPFYISVGPGGGGGSSRDGGGRGKSGGSGGGGGGGVDAELATPGEGIYTPIRLGSRGGVGAVAGASAAGGGGGGAVIDGQNGQSGIAGNGGQGILSTLSGVSSYYAGGGGGGLTLNGSTGGAGGLGGGGSRTGVDQPSVPGSATFIHVAEADQYFIVPDKVRQLSVKTWGAGGGGSRNAGGGGGGGFASATITVNPGDVLFLKVGRGGNGSGDGISETVLTEGSTKLLGGAGGWPGGGAGGPDTVYSGGAGGGGYSGIFKGTIPLLIAGGGGGGGELNAGGGGGGSTGQNGTSGLAPVGGAILEVSPGVYDATSAGPVTSIDELSSVTGFSGLPASGRLKYTVNALSPIDVSVSFVKNGAVISQSAFTLSAQPFAYTSNITSILLYSNDDHDTLTMIGDGSGIIARTNTNTISGNWDKFRGSNTLVTNSSIDAVATYTASTIVGGQSGTVVAFPLTNSEVWIRLSNQTYKVNNFNIRTFTGAEQTTIGTAAPANSHWTISDGVNQFMIGRIGSTNARIFTVNLFTGELTSEAITLTTAPTYSNGTEEDAFGSKLFAVDGVNTWHAGAQFRYSGTTGWKSTRNIFNTAGTQTVSAGTVNTQTGMDIFGSVDADGAVWFADWGHDDGGLFGIGNDDRLNIRKTNIQRVPTIVSANIPTGGTQTAGGTSYGNPTVSSGYLQGAGSGTVAGGGGGGGYYGGGMANTYGGGGGGSGYAASSTFGIISSVLTGASGIEPANPGDSDRAGAGLGGMPGLIGQDTESNVLGIKGKDGRIVISYTAEFNGRDGETNTGGGGAGGSGSPRLLPGSGGSGIVMISYLTGGYVQPPLATGGSLISYEKINGKTYKVHVFESSGALQFTRGGEVLYLIVAGGGGGGEGGGGGGGLLYGTTSVGNGSYPIVIGSGGTGSTNGAAVGTNGTSSSFNEITTTGGGRGGTTTTAAGAAGGSGGGGRRDGGGAGGLGTIGQGFAGGTSPSGAFRGAAGGGGAGGVGLPGEGTGVNTAEKGGGGGPGLAINITGSTVYYAGGGAGAAEGIGGQGLGGLGGGGNGGFAGQATQQPGAANTGGGGGGRAQLNGVGAAGAGGSGIVIIAYPSELVWRGGPGGLGGPFAGGGGGAGGYETPPAIRTGDDPNYVFEYLRGGAGADGNSIKGGSTGDYGGGGGGGSSETLAGGGGGVGVNGLTDDGSAGAANDGGGGGSGGSDGAPGVAGLYGGGGAGYISSTLDPAYGQGASGALKIYWPADANLFPEIEALPTVIPLTAENTQLEIAYEVVSDPLRVLDQVRIDVASVETEKNSTIPNYFELDPVYYSVMSQTSMTAKKPIAETIYVSTGSTQITSIETDHEMMIVNNDPTLLATWDNPTYQVIQKVTYENDPRRITVRLLNYVVGVTGEGPLVPTQIQVWF
jgi:hypothetical protein